ncbi:MAG: preprotein translocase subunit SecG [Actinobacteria bacterium]|nr:preprotein translocase subunit SecG [Actinomycetota bacterium]MBU4241212.1 preprotein translocase subunit SecG [Actinomycetota bacterium]MBU4386793.1 preprotein translocase subunit SecG [Actinomycetota bacterium]MBU4489497.1 preprotein translocase subunit SecG [Actinomycetota bacterium]MCG2795167.1 preprotein translocase subunit SecG [Actinomycetes bacterium]
MGILKTVVLVMHVGASMGLIISVMLHSGKGGGLSSALGGASPSTFSGSHIVEKNLDRITIVLGVVFSITTLLLVWMLNPS